MTDLEQQLKVFIKRADENLYKPSKWHRKSKSYKQRLEDVDVQGREQYISLRGKSLKILWWFLGIETALIFIIAFLQGWEWFYFQNELLKFKLEDWSFRLLIFATITQITLMLNIAIKHLFPKK